MVAVGGYDKKYHTAPMLERGTWTSEYNMAGHKGPIIAARFNPKFMHLRGDPNSQEVSF